MHHAFICIMKNYKSLESLLLAFVENDLPGATVLEGRGMAKILCEDFSIFSHLTSFFPDSSGNSYVLFSVVPQDQLDLCFRLASQLRSPSDRGMMCSLPIGRFESFNHEVDSETIAQEELSHP